MSSNNPLTRYYQTLGLEPSASVEEVRQAYLSLIQRWEPQSVQNNPGLLELVQDKNAELTEAYRVLIEALTDSETESEVGAIDPNTLDSLGTDSLGTDSLGTDSLGEVFPPLEDSSPAPSATADAPLDDADIPNSQNNRRAVPTAGPTRVQPRTQVAAVSPTVVESDRPPSNPQARPQSRPLDPVRESPSSSVVRLLRWDKPAGRIILAIPALWALFLASQGTPPWWLVMVILVGSVATSAAGCIVNDLWDRDIDGEVERTRNRPLATGALAGPVAIVLAIGAFGVAWFLASRLNPLSFWLCVAAVPVILLYPGAKRVFPVPQLVLAIAWGFAVLIAWTAVTGTLEPATWMLWGATVLWTLGFDTIYALADRADDERLGVQSSARFFGDRSPAAIGLFFAGAALLFIWLGLTMGLSRWYWLSVSVATLMWVWQHRHLERHRSELRLARAGYTNLFNQNVGVGLLLLAGMILGIRWPL